MAPRAQTADEKTTCPKKATTKWVSTMLSINVKTNVILIVVSINFVLLRTGWYRVVTGSSGRAVDPPAKESSARPWGVLHSEQRRPLLFLPLCQTQQGRAARLVM